MIYLVRAIIAGGFALAVLQGTKLQAVLPLGTIENLRSEISAQHPREHLRQLVETGLDLLSHNLAVRNGTKPGRE